MIATIENLKGRALAAEDGVIGKVKDVLFDDVSWGVRYLVVTTGSWFRSREVLISPENLGEVSGRVLPEQLPVKLTKSDVEGSPELVENEPISRQYEREYADYYSHAHYWDGLVGDPVLFAGATPVRLGKVPAEDVKRREDQHVEQMEKISECHLRSVNEVCGYGVAASDGEIGIVSDALVRLDGWKIPYLVVDTRKWLPGKKVVVSMEWVNGFDWGAREAVIDLTRDEVKEAPAFDPEEVVREDFESRLFRRSTTAV